MNQLVDPIQVKNINEKLVMNQLDMIFESSFFRSASQMKKFLKYIVLKTLHGEGSKIKQYAIAVDGLGLPEDFDAESNPSVRILGGRVRKRLQQYYEHHTNDELLIAIPKGAYIAEFKKTHPPLETHKKSLINFSSAPKLALVCFTDESQQKSSNQFIIRLSDYLAKALSHLIYMRLVAFIPYGDKQDYTLSVETIKKDHDVDFMISLSVQEFEDNQKEFMYRFFDVNTHEIFRTESFAIGNSTHQKTVHEDIIRDISASLVDINQGLVQINWSRKMVASNNMIPLENQALVYYRHHLDLLCKESFKKPVSSCYKILQRNKVDIVANGVLAGCCRRECSNGFGIIENPVEEGLKAAETAKNLSPHSLEPHFLFGQMLFTNAEWERAEEEFKHARSINRYCLTTKFGFGFYLCLMNRWEEGIGLIDAVITPKTTLYPSDYHLITFINYFRHNAFDDALSAAKQISNPHNFHGPVTRCISYIKLKKYDEAKIERSELLKRYPDFMEKGYQYLSRLLVNKEYVESLWKTLLDNHTNNSFNPPKIVRIRG